MLLFQAELGWFVVQQIHHQASSFQLYSCFLVCFQSVFDIVLYSAVLLHDAKCIFIDCRFTTFAVLLLSLRFIYQARIILIMDSI